MSKLDVARLREPAAWIMLVAGLVSVVLTIGHLLIGSSSGSSFTGRAASNFFGLTDPVVTALLLGAVLLVTKVGTPSDKAKPITYGAAVGLLLAAVFGMLSLLLGLFAGDGARSTVEFVLLGAPRLALTAVALVYLLPQVLPARPVAQVYHHPQFGQPQFGQPQPGFGGQPEQAFGQPQPGPGHGQQPPMGQQAPSGQQQPGYGPQDAPVPGFGPQDQPAPAAGYGQQPPSGQHPMPQQPPMPGGPVQHGPGGYGQQPPSGQHAAPAQPQPMAAQPLSGQHAAPGPYAPPADPQQPAYAPQPQQAAEQPHPQVRGALPAAPQDQQQGFGRPDSPYAPPQGPGGGQDAGYGANPGQDAGYGTNPGFAAGQDQQPFGQHAYAPADTAPTVDRPAPAHAHALPDYATPAPDYATPAPSTDYATPAPDYATPAPSLDYATPAPSLDYATPPPATDYATPAPQEYNTPPAQEYQPAPYVPADSQPSLYGHPSPNPYAPPDSFATPSDQSYPTGDTAPSVPFQPPAQQPQQPYYGQSAFDQPQQGGTPFTGYSGAEYAGGAGQAPSYQEPDPPVDPRSQQLLDAYQQAETYQSSAGTTPDLRVPDYTFGHPQSQAPYEPQQGGYEPRPYQPAHQAPAAPATPGWPGGEAQGESTVRLDPSAMRGDALDGDQRRPGDDPINPTAIYTPNEPRR
ncbi:hypothetical protein MF672_046460 [Actinomadura sp. ATCC 31491]|uniref:Uncharacterized protein n=1 Tax=Actinomadura luzonensis TaxID=2805427 RepID=A0ABT0G9C0_9ACTN|nr:hypothetical protein [Actinomadura luzonensis]MCK2221197.1 hypothetical protein [Actinomadura luzonensis]